MVWTSLGSPNPRGRRESLGGAVGGMPGPSAG